MNRAIVILGATLAVAACVADRPRSDPGQAVFDSLCAACHGSGGQGDGRVATDLPVPPADLTALAAANGGTFPREAVMAQVYGKLGRYHDSIMPEYGPLFDGATVTVASADGRQVERPRALVELVDYVETLQQ
ncbi:cytochrome c [Lutimaribacter sp. EGI FJ00015]|uniref:Cytochrome c n=1 Tax=Lutimaribacter degradans TaxID=2945989 RepID=A0ACC6A0E7_9RHOB|nr:c-type cytochrome [Lutimaribacter sp. EGI FJ00013]MCM2563835.1 cytochrome c [Lutimaribacter sp. EGI FJ00013]MCO0615010.1 cytochrome c [Lutimaribacter sp. EGI FJ00015]MCO0637674.1 cytochrome c [Lutimaribacter sp. EGI FJ00014]